MLPNHTTAIDFVSGFQHYVRVCVSGCCLSLVLIFSVLFSGALNAAASSHFSSGVEKTVSYLIAEDPSECGSDGFLVVDSGDDVDDGLVASIPIHLVGGVDEVHRTGIVRIPPDRIYPPDPPPIT